MLLPIREGYTGSGKSDDSHSRGIFTRLFPFSPHCSMYSRPVATKGGLAGPDCSAFWRSSAFHKKLQGFGELKSNTKTLLLCFTM